MQSRILLYLPPNLAVANSFPKPPAILQDGILGDCLIVDILGLENTLGSLEQLPEYYNTHNGKRRLVG